MGRTVQERVEGIEKECSGVWSSYGVTAWERSFLQSIKLHVNLSQKQDEILLEIEKKVWHPGE